MEVKIKIKIKDTELEFSVNELKEFGELLAKLGLIEKEKVYIPYKEWVWNEPYTIRWTSDSSESMRSISGIGLQED